MDLVILMGLQGSGKSTFRRLRFDATHLVVSKDQFRNNRRPQRRQMVLIEEALTAGRSVVVDNTNPRRLDRQPLLESGRLFGARNIGYILSSGLGASSRRNANRRGKARVPDVALWATASAFEHPSWSKGYDEEP
jgi:predicted kinase